MPLRSRLTFPGTAVLEPTGRDHTILKRGATAIESDLGYRLADNGSDDGDDDSEEGDRPQTSRVRRGMRVGSSNDCDQGAVLIHDDNANPRVLGGRPPVQKPITADYDSDDARIIHLKRMGYTDDYVCNKLKEEGRVRYVPKTIGARYNRIRARLEQQNDERLDDELTDWHVEDDTRLDEAYKLIDEKITRRIEHIEQMRWNEVSDLLATKMKTKKYTAKACRERLEGLHNSTAPLPIELDPDQAGRKAMREARIAEAKHLRVIHYAEQQAAEEAKNAERIAKKAEREELNRRKIVDAVHRANLNAGNTMIKEQKRRQREALARNDAQKRAYKIAKSEYIKRLAAGEEQILAAYPAYAASARGIDECSSISAVTTAPLDPAIDSTQEMSAGSRLKSGNVKGMQ